MGRALAGAAGLAAAATMTMGFAPGAYATCGGGGGAGAGTSTVHHPAVVRHHAGVPALTHTVWRWQYEQSNPGTPAITHQEFQWSRVVTPTHQEFQFSRQVPAVTHVENEFTRVVVDKAAWTETVFHPAQTHTEYLWQRSVVTTPAQQGVDQWYIWTGGPTSTPPVWSGSGWSANPGNHAPDSPANQVFQSQGGNGSWFYHELVAGTPAVTSTVTEWSADQPTGDGWSKSGQTREVVDKQAWTETVQHPAVTQTETAWAIAGQTPAGDGWAPTGSSKVVTDHAAYTEYYTGQPGGSPDASDAVWVRDAPGGDWQQSDEQTFDDAPYTVYYTGLGDSTSPGDAAWTQYQPTGNWTQVDGSERTVEDSAAVPGTSTEVRTLRRSTSAPDAGHTWVKVPGSARTIVDRPAVPAHDTVVRPARDVTVHAAPHESSTLCPTKGDPKADPAADPKGGAQGAPADPGSAVLPNTGGPADWPLLFGGALVLTGSVLLRRRRRA